MRKRILSLLLCLLMCLSLMPTAAFAKEVVRVDFVIQERLNLVHFVGSSSTEQFVSQSINEGEPIGYLPVVVRTNDDKIFDGWYTEKIGGEKVTVDTSFNEYTVLYDHWIDAPASTDTVIGSIQINNIGTHSGYTETDYSNASTAPTVKGKDNVTVDAVTGGTLFDIIRGVYATGKEFTDSDRMSEHADYTIITEIKSKPGYRINEETQYSAQNGRIYRKDFFGDVNGDGSFEYYGDWFAGATRVRLYIVLEGPEGAPFFYVNPQGGEANNGEKLAFNFELSKQAKEIVLQMKTDDGWANLDSIDLKAETFFTPAYENTSKTFRLLATDWAVGVNYTGSVASPEFTVTWSGTDPDPTTEYAVNVSSGIAEYQDKPNSYGIRPWVTTDKATAGTQIRLTADENFEKMFSGWTFNQSVTYISGTSDDKQITIQMPVGDLIATANYIEVFATQPQSGTVSVGSDYTASWTLNKTPVSDNYRLYTVDGDGKKTFEGWCNATSAIISGAGKTAGTTETYCVSIQYDKVEYFSNEFSVTWTENSVTPPAPAEYTVNFSMNGHGTQVADQTVEDGHKATKPAVDPTAEGWTFGGWYTDAACTTAFDFTTPITADTTIYAKWTEILPVPVKHTISYDLNGGTMDGSTGIVTVDIEEGTVITLPAPTREGYVFDYWEGSKYYAGDSYTVTEDHTFTAQWKEVEPSNPTKPTEYTVTFNMNGHGTQVPAQTVGEGNKVTKPADPSASGYTFDGWYADATFSAAFDFDTAINADTTIYAKWTKETSDPGATDPQPATYTVTFNMNGHGTQVPAQTVEEGNKAAKPADPSASGYTFDGWYADATFSAKFDFSSAINANTTVYAKWTEVKKDEPTKPADPTNPTQPTKPADPTSPKTGDNSHLFLWVALLFISGGALAGTAVYGKKKKYNAK